MASARASLNFCFSRPSNGVSKIEFLVLDEADHMFDMGLLPDVRRILAFSIVNQVGFMVCAIGIGTPLALNGATAHAFAHIIYKALLFMSAGVVVYRTGKHKCSEVGGLFRTMPLTAICGIIGALAISGFPLMSEFQTPPWMLPVVRSQASFSSCTASSRR